MRGLFCFVTLPERRLLQLSSSFLAQQNCWHVPERDMQTKSRLRQRHVRAFLEGFFFLRTFLFLCTRDATAARVLERGRARFFRLCHNPLCRLKSVGGCGERPSSSDLVRWAGRFSLWFTSRELCAEVSAELLLLLLLHLVTQRAVGRFWQPRNF